MKNYVISITHPAIANMCVEANTKEEAIDKAKIMLTYGAGVDFEVDIDDPGDADFIAIEQPDGNIDEKAESSGPSLKDFVVVLDAKSHKEVPLPAISAEAALALAREIYFRTDRLDFNDSDVESVTASVVDHDTSKEDTAAKPNDLKLYYLTKLVKEIRSSQAPDELIACFLRDGLDKYFANTH